MAEFKFLLPEHLGMIYGEGGGGKSTFMDEVAQYIYKRHGLITRVIGADGGGIKPYKVSMERGIVEYWPIDLWNEAGLFANLELATKGYWPADVRVPDSKLLPPYKVYRPCCFCNEESGAEGNMMVQSCKTCKKPFPAGTILDKKLLPLYGAEKVGVYVFEGGTAFGNRLLDRLRKIDPSGGNTINDPGQLKSDGSVDPNNVFKISSLGKQHYGNAQTYLAQFIANTRTLPAVGVWWTCLELRGQEDQSGKPVYGPAFPGKALTETCYPWFTDVLHLDLLPVMEGGKPKRDVNGIDVMERKIFLGTHVPSDAPLYRFKAKTSAPKGGDMPLVMEASAFKYFEELEKAFERVRQSRQA